MDLALVLPALFLIAVLFVMVPVGTAVFLHFRFPKRVTCPLTQRDAVVAAMAGRAAVGAVLGRDMLRVGACSLWDGQHGCAQTCLPSLVTAPDAEADRGHSGPSSTPYTGGRPGGGSDSWPAIMLC